MSNLAQVINALSQALVLIVFLSAILSFFMDPYHPVRRGVDNLVRPLLDPISALVYSASRDDVTDVWVAGEHLVAEGIALRLDVAEIAATADRWGQRLRKEA